MLAQEKRRHFLRRGKTERGHEWPGGGDGATARCHLLCRRPSATRNGNIAYVDNINVFFAFFSAPPSYKFLLNSVRIILVLGNDRQRLLMGDVLGLHKKPPWHARGTA